MRSDTTYSVQTGFLNLRVKIKILFLPMLSIRKFFHKKSIFRQFIGWAITPKLLPATMLLRARIQHRLVSAGQANRKTGQHAVFVKSRRVSTRLTSSVWNDCVGC